MNSKGKPLTPIDLIRNYVLMSLPDDEQTKLYEGYWHPLELLFGKAGEEEFNAFIWYWLWLKVPNRMPKETRPTTSSNAISLTTTMGIPRSAEGTPRICAKICQVIPWQGKRRGPTPSVR